MPSLNLPHAIGRRIAHFRQQRGLSQAALAKKAGLRAQRLSNLERGAQSARVGELASLATALCVTADELVFGEPAGSRLTALAAQLELMTPPEELAGLTKHLEMLLAGYAAQQAARTDTAPRREGR